MAIHDQIEEDTFIYPDGTLVGYHNIPIPGQFMNWDPSSSEPNDATKSRFDIDQPFYRITFVFWGTENRLILYSQHAVGNHYLT